MNKATIKGHGFKVGQTIEFYGMGSAGIPAEEPTLCVLGKLGNGYMLTTATGEILTWEFGTAATIYAAPHMPFDESNPATWDEDNLPTGYAWVETETDSGEFHLIAPDGRDLSEARYVAVEPACVVVAGVDNVRKVADRVKLMAYRTRATTGMDLTRAFRATIKGFNAEYGTSCRSWADVATEVKRLMEA